MKKVYNAPKVEKLDFAETACVTETILSSTGEIESTVVTPTPDAGNPGNGNNGNHGNGKGKGKGDNGHQRGCGKL